MFKYFPVDDPPYRAAMGLLSLSGAPWIDVDADWEEQLREKRRLRGERPEAVFAALPGARDAQRETLALLATHLPERYPDHYAPEPEALRLIGLDETLSTKPEDAIPPLERAGLLVQEDLCLLQPRSGETGEVYHLTAASLSFPTRWRLADKLGKPLAAIHDPVPFYGEKLERPMDRFFRHLAVERPVWRANWSVTDDPELFQPFGHSLEHGDPTIDADNAGARLHFRVERQTLRRLPETGAILFTIRIFTAPLGEVAADPARAARLRAALTAQPDEVAFYKSTVHYAAALDSYLAAHAGTDSVVS